MAMKNIVELPEQSSTNDIDHVYAEEDGAPIRLTMEALLSLVTSGLDNRYRKFTVWNYALALANNFQVPSNYEGNVGDYVIMTVGEGTGGAIWECYKVISSYGTTSYFWRNTDFSNKMEKIYAVNDPNYLPGISPGQLFTHQGGLYYKTSESYQQIAYFSSIPTKVSDLSNDVGFLAPQASIPEVPTTLYNGGYIVDTSSSEYAAVPSGQFFESVFAESPRTYMKIGSGYIELSNIARASDIPVNVSQLNNDSGFINRLPQIYLGNSDKQSSEDGNDILAYYANDYYINRKNGKLWQCTAVTNETSHWSYSWTLIGVLIDLDQKLDAIKTISGGSIAGGIGDIANNTLFAFQGMVGYKFSSSSYYLFAKRDDVYTKTETDNKIALAITGAQPMKLIDPEITNILVPPGEDGPDMTSSAYSALSVGQIFICSIENELTYWIKESASSCKNLGSGGLAFDSGVVDSEGYVHLTLDGEDIEGFTPFFIGTGGGSGGVAGINLSNVVKPSSVRNGAAAVFSFNASSTDDTNITVNWYVDGILRATESDKVSGSSFSFNAGPYLKSSDTSTVKASLSTESGAALNRQWSTTSTAFSIAFGSTIQPIMLYTANENVYVVINVSAQALTENTVTVAIGNWSTSKSVIGSKEVTFEIDKSKFSSGVNTVTATMVSAIDENDEADPISFKAMWGYGALAPIAAFALSSQSGSQYDTIPILYMAYDPANETASCTMQIGTEAARSLNANRTIQTLNYVSQDYGTKTVTLTCGASSATMALNIAQSLYNIGKITGDNLRFDLDPTGHNNSDADRTSFCNLIFSAGFDWVNGGFHTDADGMPAFVVKKGHRATLPRQIFGDADGNGKTIDISFRIENSDQKSAVAMQELNNGETKGIILKANDGELRLNNSTGQVFKYSEKCKIDLSINVEVVNDHRVMTVWLDGNPSQANVYSAGTLVQTENAFVIGSDHCDVWVYAIRVYNTSLSLRDMIQNWISLRPTTALKIAESQKNNIYTSNNVITPDSLHEANPDLTIVHISADRLPTGKKDADYVPADITIRDGSTVFTLTKEENTRHKDQGTSSMAYGRAAYNMDIEFSGSGKTYKISSSSIPVAYLNIKVNVASSENANNVCAADWYNTFQPYIVPARATAGVRDTIEGKPCAVFFTNTSSNTIWVGSQQVAPGDTVLYAMGDLCNSKKNKVVFGQTGTGEHYAKGCIEVSGNDTLAQQFKATSTYIPAEGEWQTTSGGTTSTDFEWRVEPKSEDLNEVVAAWNAAVAWLVSVNTALATNNSLSSSVTIDGTTYTTDSAAYRLAKFKAEVGDYFALDSLLFHFLYLEYFSAFDNVSKNTFYSYEYDVGAGKYLWNICKNYDDDTILGCDNDGFPLADYGADFGDTAGARSLFNADTNTIWVNIQASCQSELSTMYLTLRGRGAWDASANIAKWENYQAIRPRAAMAEDAYNKYILPNKTTGVVVGSETKSYDDSYLSRLQGPKTYQRKSFLENQAKYMDGKYGYYSTSSSIAFRANAPVGTTQDLTVKAYAKTWATIIIDNGTKISRKIEAGGTAVFPGVAVHSNATIYVTPESLIESITPIDDINNSTFAAAGASKLSEVILGSEESENTAWDVNTGLNIPSEVLKALSIRNIVNFSQALNLAANTELESLDTRGTNAGIITLPSYAPLETVYLNACTGIVALNLNAVETFNMASGSGLISVKVENCNSVVNNAMLTYLTQAVNAGGSATRFIRMTGINWNLDNPRLLNAIAANWQGYNSMGDEVSTPYLAGTVHITAMSVNNYNTLCSIFPDLTFTYDTEIPSYTVTFKNYDGTTLNTQTVERGSAPIDPRYLETNPIATPTKPQTTANTYTFDGWSWTNGGTVIADLSAVTITQDVTIYAHFLEALRKYTVTWKNGADVLETQEVDYGEPAEYSGEDNIHLGIVPKNPSEGDYATYYTFKGWDKSTTCITDNTVVNAVYDSAGAPTSKTFAQMSATEVHALIETGVLSPTGANNTMIASGDTDDIIAGNDYDFDNVDSHELIELGLARTFDGTDYYKPQIDGDDILLYDTDKSWTLAIDFAFDTSSAAGGCLAACYHSNGWQLRYNSGGSVRFGQSAAQQVSSNGVRQIIVIRKIAGDPKLYVYGSNKNGDNIVYSALSQSTAPSHNAPLCFGAMMMDDGYVDNSGKGTVFWAKLWDADLGDTVCRDIAQWPRQTFCMQAVGSTERAFRSFVRADNDKYPNLALLLKDLLEETHVIDPANSNAGGFKARPMHTWLNNRVLRAIPIDWRQLIVSVYVHTNTGQNATGLVDPPAVDKIWIPCCKDVGFNTTQSPYSLESDAPFTIFTDNTSRIKKLNFGAGAATNWWLRSPFIYYSYSFWYVRPSGASSYNYSTYSYGVAFGFCL